MEECTTGYEPNNASASAAEQAAARVVPEGLLLPGESPDEALDRLLVEAQVRRVEQAAPQPVQSEGQMQPRATSTVGSAVELHGVNPLLLPIPQQYQYGGDMQQHRPPPQQFGQGVFLPQAPAGPSYFDMAAADAASQEMPALPFHRGPLFPVAESTPMQQSILAPSFVDTGRSQMARCATPPPPHRPTRVASASPTRAMQSSFLLERARLISGTLTLAFQRSSVRTYLRSLVKC